MRISKFLPVLCAAIACMPLIAARADEDNPAQAAARAALMEKMNELDAPPQNQTSSPSASQTQTATNAVETSPAPIIVTTNGATVEQPAPAVTNWTPAAEPMPETIPAGTNTAEVSPTPTMTNTTEVTPAPPMTNSVPMPEPATETPAMTNAPEFQPAPTVTNSVATPEPAPEAIPAMTNAVATTNAAPTESPSLRIQPDAVSIAQSKEKPAKVKPSEPAKTSSPMQNPAFQPIQAPPLPISTSKEAQLEALLQKYKADQISPAEYQAERAKILAEP